MIPENNPMKANIRDSVIPQLWRDASTWKFRYRHAGRARTLTLGAYPLLTPQAARRACQVAGALVAVGRCPATERRAMAAESRLAKKPARDYVEKVAAQYLKHAKARTRASTFRETKRVFARSRFSPPGAANVYRKSRKPTCANLSTGSPNGRRQCRQIASWRT
jgi:hypothetical protein